MLQSKCELFEIRYFEYDKLYFERFSSQDDFLCMFTILKLEIRLRKKIFAKSDFFS